MNVGDMQFTKMGRAQVVAVDGREITLRLPDGSEIVVRDSGPKRPPIKKPTPRSRFEGFRSEDFKDNVTGTTWRSREQLGGTVTGRLNEGGFNSYAVYRVPEVHWACVDRWEKGREAHHAKLFAQLSADGMRFGFHVERQSNKYALSEDWRSFAHWISTGEAKSAVDRLIRDSGLSVRASLGGMPIGIQATEEGWDVVLGERAIPASGEKLGRFLTEEKPANWLGFYIEKFLPADDAIALGNGVANTIADTLNGLLPVYNVVTSGKPPEPA